VHYVPDLKTEIFRPLNQYWFIIIIIIIIIIIDLISLCCLNSFQNMNGNAVLLDPLIQLSASLKDSDVVYHQSEVREEWFSK
jgi:hypothetical protein